MGETTVLVYGVHVEENSPACAPEQLAYPAPRRANQWSRATLQNQLLWLEGVGKEWYEKEIAWRLKLLDFSYQIDLVSQGKYGKDIDFWEIHSLLKRQDTMYLSDLDVMGALFT